MEYLNRKGIEGKIWGYPMFRTGKKCERAGVYRSNDCGYEITLLEGEQFPECPLHDRHVTWTFIKKASKRVGAVQQSVAAITAPLFGAHRAPLTALASSYLPPPLGSSTVLLTQAVDRQS